MSHDLQLRHQGLFLTGACCGWKKIEQLWLPSHLIKPPTRQQTTHLAKTTSCHKKSVFIYAVHSSFPKRFPLHYCCPHRYKVLHHTNIIGCQVRCSYTDVHDSVFHCNILVLNCLAGLIFSATNTVCYCSVSETPLYHLFGKLVPMNVGINSSCVQCTHGYAAIHLWTTLVLKKPQNNLISRQVLRIRSILLSPIFKQIHFTFIYNRHHTFCNNNCPNPNSPYN